MTYAEVREMYTLDMAMVDEERDNARRAMKASLFSVFSWILPWTITIRSVLLGTRLLQMQRVGYSALLLFSAFFCGKMNHAEEGPVRFLSVALSYLVTAAVLMTAFPMWN